MHCNYLNLSYILVFVVVLGSRLSLQVWFYRVSDWSCSRKGCTSLVIFISRVTNELWQRGDLGEEADRENRKLLQKWSSWRANASGERVSVVVSIEPCTKARSVCLRVCLLSFLSIHIFMKLCNYGYYVSYTLFEYFQRSGALVGCGDVLIVYCSTHLCISRDFSRIYSRFTPDHVCYNLHTCIPRNGQRHNTTN